MCKEQKRKGNTLVLPDIYNKKNENINTLHPLSHHYRIIFYAFQLITEFLQVFSVYSSYGYAHSFLIAIGQTEICFEEELTDYYYLITISVQMFELELICS